MKKLRKDTRRFVQAGVGLGVGVGVVAGAEAQVPAGAGVSALPAMGTMGSMLRPLGTARMGGHTLRMLGKYGKKRKKKY